MLERVGYPFKSKEHSQRVHEYQTKYVVSEYLQRYIDGKQKNGEPKHFQCPKMLRYQFTPEFKLKVSHLCCKELKKKPADHFMKENGRTARITGMMREEGGQRENISCVLIKDNKIKAFHPLAKVTHEWNNGSLKPITLNYANCTMNHITLKEQDVRDVHIIFTYKVTLRQWKSIFQTNAVNVSTSGSLSTMNIGD